MKNGNKEYFLLINYYTKKRLLCSWSEDEPDFFGQRVYFIGNTTNGLGGYNKMIASGFIDRRFLIPHEENKVRDFIFKNRGRLKCYQSIVSHLNSLYIKRIKPIK